MRYSAFTAAAVALATSQLVSAQTFTDCDPTKKTCPADPALGKTITIDFTKGASSEFDIAAGTTLTYGANGAEFTINKETDAPTITSKWYIFFGKVDVVMKAAPGIGVVSSFVMESDDLDEIDWEWLGGDTTEVETNYFGKGNTATYDRATYVPVSAPQDTFHTYTIDWTSSAIKWYVDGALIRTLNYADASGGAYFPQTPMQIKMGNWNGGASTSPKGTVEWAGGYTDFSKAPFTMYVKSVTIQDYATGGSEYVYGDLTGSWQSIKVQGSSSNSTSGSSSSSASSAASSAASSTKASSAASSTKAATTSAGSSNVTSTAGSGNLGAGAVTQPAGSAATTLVSTTAAGTGSAASASASASASATTKTNMGASVKPSRYGMADYVVVAMGLVIGYFVM